MKKLPVILSAIAFFFSASTILSQQVAAGAQTDATVNAENAHVGQSTDVNASASADRGGAAVAGDAQAASQVQMHPVNAELMGKLDAKTARPGDQVVVKTHEAFRTSEGVVVPKGSRLVGHVTEVQAHSKASEDSRLGIEFSRAELKSGESLRVHSMIQSVAPPASAMAAASIDSTDDVGAMGGGGHAMGGGHVGGGGLLGGASAATSTATGVGSGLGRTAGGSVGAASSLTSSTGAAVGSGLNGAVGTSGSLGARATAIPGVMLQADAAGSASGVLSASKHNLHLDSGTQMTLGIAGAMGR